MQEIVPGVFVETGFRRVTVGAIVTDDGLVLVDVPPFPDDARIWRELLADVSDQPILAIICTDCHSDRIVGSCWLDARVTVAHEETVGFMQNLPSTFLDNAVALLTDDDPLERGSFSGARLRLPSIGFSRKMQLRYGGRDISLLSMPGPTVGSLWVHLADQRILFAGDSVLVDQHPHIFSPSTKSWLENLTNLRRDRFPADQIVSGRGPVVDKSATEPISNYLRLARRRVHSLYRAGRPRADTSSLVPELLDLFPYREEEFERIQRRIKAGLDRIYEEFKTNDRAGEGLGF